MADTERLQVVVSAIDHLTAPFKAMAGSVGQFAATAQGNTMGSLTALQGGLERGSTALGAHKAKWDETIAVTQKAGMVITGAGAAITGSLVAATQAASDLGSELWDMHTRTGASVESLSAMKYAAEQTGSSLSGVQTGLKFIAKNAWESIRTGTGPAADAFKALGISATDASGKLKSSEALFVEVGTALRGVKNDSERTALAMALFGRSGQELLPMFLDTKGSIQDLMAEAKNLGIVMSTEAAEAADDFGDTLDKLKTQGKMAFVSLGTAAMPVLQSLGNILSWGLEKMQAFRAEYPLLSSAAVAAAGGLGLLFTTVGPLLIVIPSLVQGWIFLSNALTITAIKANVAKVSLWQTGVAAQFSATWAKIGGAWTAAAAVKWDMFTVANLRAAWASRASAIASAFAGGGALRGGTAATIGAVGWTGFTVAMKGATLAMWGGVKAAWAFIASPLGVTLVAAAAAILLVVRACRMGAEAWKAWHDAKEGKKRTERQEEASKAEGLVTPAAVAKDMGLEKKWERGTMSAEENARFQAELQRRMKAAGEARRKAGTAGGMKTDWAGDMGTAAQADSPDALQADMEKIKAEAAAMQASMGAAPTMPATPETKAGGAAAGGPAAVYKFDETSMGLLRSIADTTKEILGKMGGGGVSYQKRTDAQGKVNWDKITLPAAQPALRSANAGAGGGGINLTVNANIDARGATDPAAVRQAGQQGATQAGQEALRMFKRNMGKMGLQPQGTG